MSICLYKREDGKDFPTLLEEDGGAFSMDLLGAYNEAKENRMYFPYMTDIVSDTICADYLDYLQRDPSNVGLDVLRDDRVTTSFYVGLTSSRSHRMALALRDRNNKPRLDVATAVVELVRQRYRFAEIIYYHKTKVAASAMLAKVFTYIRIPSELPSPGRQTISLRDIGSLATEFSQWRADEKEKFCDNLRPSAMLDLEVGDESLLMLLLQQGLTELQKSSAADSVSAKRILTGICLLQMLWQRNLYKVACTIYAENYIQLHTGSPEQDEVDKHIEETLKRFRDDARKRNSLESKMSEAAGFPEGSLILYVPGRKSQAKGIETGAFSNNIVVQLDKHEIVREEVRTLGEKYKKLWRIILLVHPDYRSEHQSLSRAVDVLLAEIWPGTSYPALGSYPEEDKLDAILDVCWFNYVPRHREASANLYMELRGKAGLAADSLDWSLFVSMPRRTIGASDTLGTKEHAYRAFLLDLAQAKDEDRIRRIHNCFPNPGDLTSRMDEILRDSGVEDSVQSRVQALRQIAQSLEGTLPGTMDV